ncbi:hypothetical protein FRC06_009708 [Ceratobasidium sp. 370]|nr:hypothetical protein FRC06_009708 [Ceratobasidium sp. 370]
MAPKTIRSAPGTKVYDFAKHPTRIAEIAAAIAQTTKMMVMCGPGVSSVVPSKDMPLQLAHNGYTSATTLRAAIDDCSTLNPHAKQLGQDKLAAFSVTMTRLRMQARTAPLTSFHQFLQRAFSEKRVACCLTENFDGLEERDAPQADCPVVMVNGDNRWLRCCMSTCKGVNPTQAAELDMRLLSAEMVPCPGCVAEAAKMKSQRAAGPPALRFLRPAVRSDMDGDLQPGGKTRDAVLEAAEDCDLLLVVGVSLRSRATFKLVQDVATAIHGRYGAVIYVDPQAVKGIKIDHCIDFHLKVDAQLCSQRILRAMDEVANHNVGVMLLDDDDPSDMWYDLLGGQSIEQFICPYCWDHRERGVYPHYVRPAPRVFNEEPGDSAPRMAMIPAPSPWKAGSFDLFVVYITHGLSESRGYQLSHNTSLAAPELFNRTLAPAEGIFTRAKSKYAFLVCCGTPFDYADASRELQQWINNSGTFNALIGCLNKKLAPAFIINLIARVTTSLVGIDESPGEEVLNCWLSDSLACSHTDLIYVAKGHVHCKQCWDRWMDRQFGPETNGVQVMEGSITCPACREVSATPCGRPVALYAAPVGESEKVEDMLKQIEVFESRQGAIAQEMARIADDIKQWEQHAAEWSGHIDKVEDALKRLDAAKGKDLG